MKFVKSLILLAGTILMLSASALAQSEPSDLPPPPPPDHQEMLMVGGGFGFVSFETGLHGPVVKGAPYSAQVVTEITQTLIDGNHIDQKRTALVYRDSQGRTRREESLPALGPVVASGNVHHAIFVNDPVAGVHYVLDPDQKIAHKMSPPADVKVIHEHVAGMRGAKPSDQLVTESLGTQTMEGLAVTGTRTTRTVPAGAIGNEKPIQIVLESWYSPDLQMVIYSKHTDPRMGETVYQVTNIQRTEPDASLFQVPSDYTVQEGHPGHNMLYINRQQ